MGSLLGRALENLDGERVVRKILITDPGIILNRAFGEFLRGRREVIVLRELFGDPGVALSASRQLTGAVANGNNYRIEEIDIQGIKYVSYSLEK